MAEVVEKAIEDSLGEFSHIRKTKLFNEDEIREIIRRRRHHEYSLQKRNKRIIDYESYITSEMGILRLLSIKRQKNSDFRFTDKVEKSIVNRLVRLHRQVCYRFQSRVDVWLRFIRFARLLGRHTLVTRLWDRLLQVHGRTDARLWAASAAFHLDEGARAEARASLSKLSAESMALKRSTKKIRKLSKAPSCAAERVALQLETQHLGRLKESLGRCIRLTWDRTLLLGIREARRILTLGLTFNKDSPFLFLELLKLEASAVDFFTKRVLLRREQANAESTTAPEKGKRKPQNRGKADLDSEREDGIAFLSEVTEDIDFIVSGGAFILVLDKFVEIELIDAATLSFALEIATAIPKVSRHSLIAALTSRLAKLEELKEVQTEKIVEQISAGQQEVVSVVAVLTAQEAQLRAAGLEEGLSLWKNWYPSAAEFRKINPSLPEAVSLLAARLNLAHLSNLQRPQAEALSNLDASLALETYHEYNSKHGQRVAETRSLLDSLAVSNWGSMSSDFWRLYVAFEKKLGDCSRIPAVEWRAQASLKPLEVVKFRNQSSTPDFSIVK